MEADTGKKFAVAKLQTAGGDDQSHSNAGRRYFTESDIAASRYCPEGFIFSLSKFQ